LSKADSVNSPEEMNIENKSFIQATPWEIDQHILFPTDFSETDHQVFEHIKEMASAGD